MSVTATQGSLRNWAAGGDKFSLAIASNISYYFFHRHGKKAWDNNFEFNFGMIKTSSLGVRKNDDRFDYLSKYGYNFRGKWFVSSLFNMRTQFFHGYAYTDTSKKLVSRILSPGYFLLSLGVDYKPNPNFSFFISPVTSRLVLVIDKQLSNEGAYGVPPGHNTYNEFGAFSTINAMYNIGKVGTYKGRLDLFSNYAHNPFNIDVYMTNLFVFKISKYFSATYNLDLIYDDDVKLFGEHNNSPGLQLKSLIGLGF